MESMPLSKENLVDEQFIPVGRFAARNTICEIARPISELGDGASPVSGDLGARQRMTRHVSHSGRNPINFGSSTHFKKCSPNWHRKGSIMPSPVLLFESVCVRLGCLGSSSVALYWPALKERPSPENLKPILLLHGFRFLGLAFVVPGLSLQSYTTTLCSTSSLR